jgi:hypothetical protein
VKSWPKYGEKENEPRMKNEESPATDEEENEPQMKKK